MSYELSVIDRNVPIETEVPEYEFTGANRQAVLKFSRNWSLKVLGETAEVRTPPTSSLEKRRRLENPSLLKRGRRGLTRIMNL